MEIAGIKAVLEADSIEIAKLNMKKTEVSIVIPVYNRESLLPKAVESVLCQSFRNFEIIIIDDGSTDNTGEIGKRIAEGDDRIFYFYQENKGPAVARNLGISKASGEYIAFLDSDDEWLPEKLERQIALFRNNPGLGFAGCNHRVFVLKHSRETVKEYNLYNKLFPVWKNCFTLEDFLSFHSPIVTSSILVKAGVLLETGGFDEKCPVHQDYELWIRLSEKYKFDVVKQPMVKSFEWSGGISKTASFVTRSKVKNYILDKHKDSYKKYPRAKAKVLRNIGTDHMMAGNKREAVKYFLKSVKTYPFSLRNYLNLVVFPLGSKIYKIILHHIRT